MRCMKTKTTHGDKDPNPRNKYNLTLEMARVGVQVGKVTSGALHTAPEPPAVPDSGRRPPSKRGKTPVPVTSVHPEAPDNLLEALRSASIDEEHRTIMSVVVQKVQSAKSGLTEACASLLTGFEVSVRNIGKILPHRQ